MWSGGADGGWAQRGKTRREVNQMAESASTYQVVAFPSDRLIIPLVNTLNARKHFMYGLMEVDVTVARERIAKHKQETGELLSFTGYLVFCLARAIAETKTVQAVRKGNRQLILFDDVDVGLLIEHQKGERRVLDGYVVRHANCKSFIEINREIRAAQHDSSPERGDRSSWFQTLLRLPPPLSSLVSACFRFALYVNPTLFTTMAGTVGVTAVGMFGKGVVGWGLVPVMHTLDLIVGSVTVKPVVVGDHIVPREILNLTVVFDHDVIDGAPATRFTRRLVELVASGCGLEEGHAGGDREGPSK